MGRGRGRGREGRGRHADLAALKVLMAFSKSDSSKLSLTVLATAIL